MHPYLDPCLQRRQLVAVPGAAGDTRLKPQRPLQRCVVPCVVRVPLQQLPAPWRKIACETVSSAGGMWCLSASGRFSLAVPALSAHLKVIRPKLLSQVMAQRQSSMREPS